MSPEPRCPPAADDITPSGHREGCRPGPAPRYASGCVPRRRSRRTSAPQASGTPEAPRSTNQHLAAQSPELPGRGGPSRPAESRRPSRGGRLQAPPWSASRDVAQGQLQRHAPGSEPQGEAAGSRFRCASLTTGSTKAEPFSSSVCTSSSLDARRSTAGRPGTLPGEPRRGLGQGEPRSRAHSCQAAPLQPRSSKEPLGSCLRGARRTDSEDALEKETRLSASWVVRSGTLSAAREKEIWGDLCLGIHAIRLLFITFGFRGAKKAGIGSFSVGEDLPKSSVGLRMGSQAWLPTDASWKRPP